MKLKVKKDFIFVYASDMVGVNKTKVLRKGNVYDIQVKEYGRYNIIYIDGQGYEMTFDRYKNEFWEYWEELELTVEVVSKVLEEELILLRKLIVEYWKDTPDAEEDIGLEISYEEWVYEYVYDLIRYNNNVEDIKKEVRIVILRYLEEMKDHVIM